VRALGYREPNCPKARTCGRSTPVGGSFRNPVTSGDSRACPRPSLHEVTGFRTETMIALPFV
jgi:hypothetical protein